MNVLVQPTSPVKAAASCGSASTYVCCYAKGTNYSGKPPKK